eukprot:TRINITY_DN5453_c0_g1_i1.p2 TRINITY_DN5453_c0_g1~~TRINITY_DN5453_c0_g1_i1.p2  ORF type:complete len:339 (-),score=92.75 TRINITY_DN5453_c0_g1_i1:18-1034(-)
METVRSILGRLNRTELYSLAHDWEVATVTANDKASLEKKELLDRIIAACCTEGLSKQQLADIDTKLVHARPHTRRWTAFQLQTDTGAAAAVPVLTAAELQRQMHRALLAFFPDVHTAVYEIDGATWLHINVDEQGTYATHNSAVAIHPPHSPYVFAAQMRGSLKPYFVHSVVVVLQAARAGECTVSARDPVALRELLLNRSSLGAFSQYRFHEADSGALRRRHDLAPAEGERAAKRARVGAGVEVLDEARLQAREAYADQTFGRREQPAVSRIEAQVVARASEGGEEVRCQLRLEGGNVLQGLRELVPLGLAAAPLPDFLATLAEQASRSVAVAAPVV